MPAITIKRKWITKGSRKVEQFFIDPIYNEPLTRMQLTKFLYGDRRHPDPNKWIGACLSECEIAFMYEEFRMHPTYTWAEFGVNGYFTVSG